jgi:hypothetical protein
MSVSEPLRRYGSVAALTGCLVAGGSIATVGATTVGASGAQQAAVTRLQAHLRPSGDPDGSGEAKIRIDKARGRVCATVVWHKIGKPNAAHIHRQSDGAVVVPLTGSVTGGKKCATGVSKALIGKILAHPKQYYFNVHNAKYPAGAIKGTLRR